MTHVTEALAVVAVPKRVNVPQVPDAVRFLMRRGRLPRNADFQLADGSVTCPPQSMLTA